MISAVFTDLGGLDCIPRGSGARFRRPVREPKPEGGEEGKQGRGRRPNEPVSRRTAGRRPHLHMVQGHFAPGGGLSYCFGAPGRGVCFSSSPAPQEGDAFLDPDLKCLFEQEIFAGVVGGGELAPSNISPPPRGRRRREASRSTRSPLFQTTASSSSSTSWSAGSMRMEARITSGLRP